MQAFVLYLTAFRLAIITAGIVSIVLGYRLFVRGVWPESGSGDGTSVEASVAGSSFTLKNAAPGTCFALFGVLIIAVMFAVGSPELTLQTLQQASAPADEPSVTAGARDPEGSVTTRLTMRSPDTDVRGPAAVTQEGIYYESQRDTAAAIAAYREAVSMVAAPMNYLAWLYLKQGKVQEALPLSRLSVQLVPDSANFLDTLGEILFEIGEYSEALNAIERAASLDTRYSQKLLKFREAVRQ